MTQPITRRLSATTARGLLVYRDAPAAHIYSMAYGEEELPLTFTASSDGKALYAYAPTDLWVAIQQRGQRGFEQHGIAMTPLSDLQGIDRWTRGPGEMTWQEVLEELSYEDCAWIDALLYVQVPGIGELLSRFGGTEEGNVCTDLPSFVEVYLIEAYRKSLRHLLLGALNEDE